MIKLWDGYAIYADEHQVMLGKPIPFINKQGESLVRYDHETYHLNLASALLQFQRLQARRAIERSDMTLRQAIEAMNGIEDRIRALVKEPDFTDVKMQGEQP